MMQNKSSVAFFLSFIMIFSLMFSSFGVAFANEMVSVDQEQMEKQDVLIQSTDVVNASTYSISGIAINPGRNESELYFAWYSPRGPTGTVVQFAEKSDMVGNEFPIEQATTFEGTATNAVTGFSSNKVVVTGLVPRNEYVYRLGDGNDAHWSPVYEFKTQATDEYSFLMYGDPQIGVGGNVTSNAQGWVNTVNNSLNQFPDVNFLVSVGDQVETATSEAHYDGYFAPEQLKNFAMSTVQGNHDNQINYQYHFNTPNHSPEYISTNAGGNHYYTYGNTLFMVLNTNARSGAGHKAFMQEAIANHPDVEWKVVINHQSLYSSANHSTSSTTADLRANLFPVFDELEIDVVLAGHDHSYTRSYHMLGDQPQLQQTVDPYGRVVNPTGTLYITNNSASGSKYYNLRAPAPHEAVVSQPRVPTFSHVEVTDNSFTITAYITDTMEIVDTYTIVKDPSIAPPELSELMLSTEEQTLATTPSTVVPNEITLSLRGVSENGFNVPVSSESLQYKTSPEDVLNINSDGLVTIANRAYNGQVEVWAEVTQDGQAVTSNKVILKVQHIKDTILLKRGSEWKYLDNGSDQGIAWRTADFGDSAWSTGAAPLGYPISESRPTFGSVNTLIDFGPNSSSKYATYYFRTEFTIDDLSKIGDRGMVGFGIDDGVVLYLNGQEIGRFNHPEGEVPYNKYLQDFSGFGVANENQFETFVLDETHMAYLVEGVNILAAEVRQDRPNSSDIYWDMEFTAAQTFTPDMSELANLEVEGGELTSAFQHNSYEYFVKRSKEEPLKLIPTVFTEDTTITVNGEVVANRKPSNEIPLNNGKAVIKVADSNGNETTYTLTIFTEEAFVAKGSEWKYLDDGSNQYTSLDQMTDWRHPDYDDRQWKSGPALLGYGGYNGEKTTVGFGPSSSNKYPTTYFRKTIEIENPDAVFDLNLSILRDDGAVVYLNGVEVFRNNMPEGEIGYLTLAASTIGKDYNYYSTEVVPTLLRKGENVLAVSIHQDRRSSSDIVFDLEMVGKTSAKQQPIEAVNLEIVTAPNLVTYIEGEDLEVDGAVVRVTFSDGSTKDVEVTAEMVSGYDKSTLGTQTITVSVEGVATEFQVTVIAKQVTSIAFISDPKIFVYEKGAEELSIEGVTILATYNDGTEETVAITQEMISGFDSSALGEQEITITYENDVLTFVILIVENIKESPAAPAVATSILKENNLPNVIGTGKSRVNIVSEVAQQMGKGADFNGISKEDRWNYYLEVKKYLKDTYDLNLK
ncbi:bacterial Ig-like domain-containing protein [Alkalihalobacterium alkalinitrilicum]|uniref:bacterial Ig-like domain-containing protein n=1 Tax=Alkalihalobacterium alkalinitrilicum TaxID=427920 RepID=UPI00099504C0|nr:bacterial Ig-like domain-containing protein [Alkalihalobacterium alkalinitrilicum]